MILHSTVSDQAILSNVQGMGEFRIRNSAKAFSILSSGLYANKIRAIIRELSCNAIDSHTDNGNVDTPFDVHLPTSLEPWFAVRDYGTGLSHGQVHSIYTTYFESTKTGSNDFVGALGLGSKSPFSYTDNFTVTAVKDGCKSVYSAFINQDGVPSIVLMQTNKRFVVSTKVDSETQEEVQVYSLPVDEEDCTDPNGVEVKFSVNDRHDYNQFEQEAQNVFTYFAHRPVVTGVFDFRFNDIKYGCKDIIPGVHTFARSSHSYAIMGNIAYPINIPGANNTLDNLRHLLDCGLEIHFAIGELDFQASREGLSYIPQTIEAIRKRLELLNVALVVKLEEDASKIKNLWARAFFLMDKKSSSLWSPSVSAYLSKNPIATIKPMLGYLTTENFEINVEVLAKKYNISVSGLSNARSNAAFCSITNKIEHNYKLPNAPLVRTYRDFAVRQSTWFIIDDIKRGAIARTRYHCKNNKEMSGILQNQYSIEFHILSQDDTSKPANFKKFLKDIKNPPNVINASTMDAKPTVSRTSERNVSILSLCRRGGVNYRYSARYEDMVWRKDKKLDAFDDTAHYYLPLRGCTPLNNAGELFDAPYVTRLLEKTGVPNRFEIDKIYGVRKADLASVRAKKNWVNLEEHLIKTLNTLTEHDLSAVVAREMYNKYDSPIKRDYLMHVVDKTSMYYTVVSAMSSTNIGKYSADALKSLCEMFGDAITNSPVAFVKSQLTHCADLIKHYPLLMHINNSADSVAVAQYINLIDASGSGKI